MNERPFILRQVQQKWLDANGRFYKYQCTKHEGRLVAEALLPLDDKFIQNELHKRFITTKSNMSQPRKKQGKSVWNSRFSKNTGSTTNMSSNNSESSNEVTPTFRFTDDHSRNKAPWLQNISTVSVTPTAGVTPQHNSISSVMNPPFASDATLPPFVTNGGNMTMGMPNSSNSGGSNDKLFVEWGIGARKRQQRRTIRTVSDDATSTTQAANAENASELDELKRLVSELRHQVQKKDATIQQLTTIITAN